MSVFIPLFILIIFWPLAAGAAVHNSKCQTALRDVTEALQVMNLQSGGTSASAQGLAAIKWSRMGGDLPPVSYTPSYTPHDPAITFLIGKYDVMVGHIITALSKGEESIHHQLWTYTMEIAHIEKPANSDNVSFVYTEFINDADYVPHIKKYFDDILEFLLFYAKTKNFSDAKRLFEQNKKSENPRDDHISMVKAIQAEIESVTP